MEEETQKRIDELREKLGRTSLRISRIPEQTKTEFILLAQNEFESDYGMALKWLMDFRNGILTSPNQELSTKIDILAEEINAIKVQLNAPKTEEKPVRKSLSGKIIGGRK